MSTAGGMKLQISSERGKRGREIQKVGFPVSAYYHGTGPRPTDTTTEGALPVVEGGSQLAPDKWGKPGRTV